MSVVRQKLIVFTILLAASCSALPQAANHQGSQPAGQEPAAGTQGLVFDVASIRVSTTANDGRHHIYNDPRVSLFRTVNLSLKDLIQFAYGVPRSQIAGGPDWLESAMFDVTAKSDASVDAQLHAMTSQEARSAKQHMVQALLGDRFRLQVHEEMRPLPAFSLVITNPKSGPKFQPSPINGTTIEGGRSRLHVAGSDDTISLLTRELAQVLGRPVLNRTGLTGRYDLTLRWTPDDAPAPLLNGSPDPNAPPNIFTAINEQLGLKLEPTKDQVPVLVIDHVEHPTEN